MTHAHTDVQNIRNRSRVTVGRVLVLENAPASISSRHPRSVPAPSPLEMPYPAALYCRNLILKAEF